MCKYSLATLHTINGSYPNIENYVRKLRFLNLAFIEP